MPEIKFYVDNFTYIEFLKRSESDEKFRQKIANILKNEIKTGDVYED
jgi:hypothetical protein